MNNWIETYHPPTWLASKLRDHRTEEPPLALWHYPGTSPLPFFPAFRLPHPSSHATYPYHPPPPSPDNSPLNKSWSRAAAYIEKRGSQCGALRLYGHTLKRHNAADCRRSDLRPFRLLGIVIWDNWRVYQIGLLEHKARQRTPTPDGGYIEGFSTGLVPTDLWEMIARWVALVD
ncbi:hypothetical protein BJX70DRAFT_367910 [Aspergillus crustosus]